MPFDATHYQPASEQAAIDAALASACAELKQQRRCNDHKHIWASARGLASRPRSVTMQSGIGTVLYDDPLVYRALNQRFVDSDYAKLLALSGYRYSRTPLRPLTQAEEIAVCRKLIRRLGEMAVYYRNSRRDYLTANYRILLAAELVRLGNALDGRTWDEAQEDYGWDLDQTAGAA